MRLHAFMGVLPLLQNDSPTTAQGPLGLVRGHAEIAISQATHARPTTAKKS